MNYPVRYFNCKSLVETDMQAFFTGYVSFFSQIGTFLGEVKGETGIPGLKLDFNNGLRLQVPAGNWHVHIHDYVHELNYFEEDIQNVILVSVEKYFIHWQIDVYQDDQMVFSHQFDPTNQRVHFIFCSRGLGDNLAFLPYIGAFLTAYQAQGSYYAPEWLQGICERYYPELVQQEKLDEDNYVTFFFNMNIDSSCWIPLDGRIVPMDQIGQVILDLPYKAELRSWIPLPRQIREKYVCIAVQASGAIKGWHYPHGWDLVVDYLKAQGYRVLCIDKERHQEQQQYVIDTPTGAEDFTGNIPLEQRADMLYHAAFFIGLGSGLSWLAHLVGCPVIMIGGFSRFWYEFPNPYRVYNPMVCNGCFNDLENMFIEDPCPYQKKTPERELECSKKISPRQVLLTIERLRLEMGC